MSIILGDITDIDRVIAVANKFGGNISGDLPVIWSPLMHRKYKFYVSNTVPYGAHQQNVKAWVIADVAARQLDIRDVSRAIAIDISRIDNARTPKPLPGEITLFFYYGRVPDMQGWVADSVVTLIPGRRGYWDCAMEVKTK